MSRWSDNPVSMTLIDGAGRLLLLMTASRMPPWSCVGCSTWLVKPNDSYDVVELGAQWIGQAIKRDVNITSHDHRVRQYRQTFHHGGKFSEEVLGGRSRPRTI